MTETKFTPGPWRHALGGNFANIVEAHTGRSPRHAGDDGYAVVASVQACVDAAKRDDQDVNCAANIALIAAAPDLYAALDDLCRVGGEDDGTDVFEKAKAALRKARGE